MSFSYYAVPFALLGGTLLLVCLLLWTAKPRFSKQERDFVSYVQEEARKRNLRKEDVDSFIFTNFDILMCFYAGQHGPLMLNNVHALKNHIRDTY